MEKLIILNSITYAYKARDLLYKYGIKVFVERIPVGLRVNGCGYGIKIKAIDEEKIMDILKEGKFKNIKVISI